MSEFIKKNITDIKSSNPSKAYSLLKRLGARPGDCDETNEFVIPSHTNLTSDECAERIANHFSQISQEFDPLDVTTLPARVKVKVNNISSKSLPSIHFQDVYEKIRSARKPKSCVPGDIPSRLVKEFAAELTIPVTKIFESILNTNIWPSQWKVEYVTPIQKKPQPDSEDQLRTISLAHFFSKVFEKFVILWLFFYVEDKLDPGQYGGLKGSSTTHYLVDFVNFILYNQDMKNPHMVLACMVDYSKAFNRMDHNTLITILSDMGVPGWLLRLVIAFLTNRTMILRYKGSSSSSKSLPGGGPHGTLLGLFLFLILINSAGFHNLNNKLGEIVTKVGGKRKPIERTHMKYVDDMTIAESINIQEKIVPHPDLNPDRPLTFHGRTGHYLPPEKSEVHSQILNLAGYSDSHKMKINVDKTKLMIFNPSKTVDIHPIIELDHTQLEIVESMKLLGVIVSSDMKWHLNTEYITKRGFSRIWILRRLKKYGVPRSELIDAYIQKVRSLLEMAVPVWNPALTRGDATSIERVQKSALRVILGDQYLSYNQAMATLELDNLESRREKRCVTFASKSAISSRLLTF